jgi:glycosyltransferase involved in cell wall biosynthesis
MKILFIWDSDYPWDVRVEKISQTLIENGWEVHLVCRNRLRRPAEEVHEGIHIHRISFLPKNYGTLNELYGFPAFFNPVWIKRIGQVATAQDVDAIIVRDLPLALTACLIGKIRRIPVILDMAECYPELVRLIWKFEPFRFQNIFIRNPYVVDCIEKFVIKMADHVFVMVEESRDRLLRKGVDSKKISIVSNTPVLKKFESVRPTFPGAMANHQGKLLLLYVGFLNFSRGLDTVMESLSQYVKMDNNIFLALLGTGNAESHLREMSSRLSLGEYVGFEGWVDSKMVPEYIASSDICLVPHHKCSHWDNTIPNKLFDYMASGKPVLVSNVKPMERIVNETNCGFVYKDKDPESFVLNLEKLRNKDVRKILGEYGIKAIQEHYNWENDSCAMVRVIEQIVRT